ncbi:MAG: hypothetical protein V5A24_05620, partial [Haloarculaceae archaeon]
GFPALVGALAVVPFALASRYDRALLAHLGGLLLVGAVVLAGVGTADQALVLVATVATVVAWDAATTAMALDAQFSPAASTARAEAVHTGATLLVGTLIAGTVFLLSRASVGDVPAAVAVTVIAAAVVFLVVLDPRPG